MSILRHHQNGGLSSQPTTDIVEHSDCKIEIRVDGKTFGYYIVPDVRDIDGLREIVSQPDWEEDSVNDEIERLWASEEKLREDEGEALGGEGFNQQWRC